MSRVGAKRGIHVRAGFSAIGVVLVAMAACGGDSGEGPSSATTESGTTSSTGGAGGGIDCPTGAWPLAGECVAIGPQGCDPKFVGDDGLCVPTAGACPEGTVPDIDAGCAPLGPAGCAAEFVEAGLCAPKADACAPGTIPRFDQGCVPVGPTKCAASFVGADGVCRPTPDACGPNELPLPSGCAPLDGPEGCGSGPFGDVVDGPNTVWVLPGATGGDGTKAKPVATIAEALALVPPGGRVVLASGVYDEPIVPPKSVEIVGRCPSMVQIRGVNDDFDRPVVALVKGFAKVTLRRLRLEGPGVGLRVLSGKATLDHVHIEGARYVGIDVRGPDSSLALDHTLVRHTDDTDLGAGLYLVFEAVAVLQSSAFVGNRAIAAYATDLGTMLAADDCVFANTLPAPGDDAVGVGIQLELGAYGLVTESAFIGNRTLGIAALNGSTIDVKRSVVADTLEEKSTGTYGYGSALGPGVAATFESVALVGNRGSGIQVDGEGTNVVIEGSLVANTLPRVSDKTLGLGISVSHAASLELRDSTLVGNRTAALVVTDKKSKALVERSLLADTAPQAQDGAAGSGVLVQLGGQATLRDVVVRDSHESGLGVQSKGSSLVIERTVVKRTAPRPDGLAGYGLIAVEGAKATALSSAFLESHEVGIVTEAAGSWVALDRCLVADTAPRPSDGLAGRGAQATLGAKLDLVRSAILRSREGGVVAASPDTTLLVDRCLIEGTLPRSKTGLLGRGLAAQDGAAVTAIASSFVGNHESAIAAIGTGTRLALSQSVIDDTQADDTDAYGLGLNCSGGEVSVQGTLVRRSRTAGLLLSSGNVGEPCRATLDGLYIDGVASGSFHTYDPNDKTKIVGTFEGIADGLVTAFGSESTTTRTEVQGVGRAAFVFDSSRGTLHSVRGEAGQFGLVIQSSPELDYQSPTNTFVGGEEHVLTDSELPVPSAPAIPTE